MSKKSTAEKVIDIWVKYSNHLIENGLDMKAINMRTDAMAKTTQLIEKEINK